MDETISFLKAAAVAETKENSPETLTAFTFPVENRNGYTFGVLAIKSRPPSATGLVDLVQTGFADLAASIQEKTSVAYSFEKTLEAVNESIAEWASQFAGNIDPQKILALVGAAVDNTMYISGRGEIMATFLHKLPDQRYRVFNLARSIQTEQVPISWDKFFSVVLDGDLTPSDILCVSNQPLQQEISPEDFNALLATLPPQSATVKIRQYFPMDIDLALVILKAEDLEKPTAAISAPSSLNQLHNSREATKKILADQKPTFVGTLAARIFSSFKNSRGGKQIIRVLIKILIAAVKIAVKMMIGLVIWLVNSGRRLTSATERKNIMRDTQSAFSRGTNQLRGFFNRLPKTSKYLVLAAVALVFILVFGIFLVSRAHQNNQEQQAFTTTIEKVETLRDKASGAIIYKNETQAKSLLKEAQTLLTTVQGKKQEDKDKITALQTELDKISNGLRRDTEVNPETLASASSLTPPTTLNALALVNGELYSFGNDKVIYHINKNSKTLETTTTNETAVYGQEVSVDGEVAVWLDEKPSLDILEVADKKLTVTSAAPATDQRWVDLYAYADRVYILAPGSGLTSQIYRFARTGSELSSATNWVKSPTDSLSDGVSLAVDGTVFVLKQNGKIVRLVGGQEVGWTQGAVDPVLTSASDIWTSADSDYLYVLDPAGQRLIVYEKESGNLKVQYHSGALTGLTDFAVDETNKTIYLLGNGNVYKFEASHLK